MYAASCSPYGNGAFQCAGNSANCGTGGQCVDNYCAFPDSTCASGLRFGALSGPSSNACYAATIDGGVGSDATFPDGGRDGGALDCYGSAGGLVAACFNTAPSGTKVISTDIDTDSSPMCATGVTINVSACVVAGGDVTVMNTVHVTGSKPLVVVSVGTLAVAGTLDAASHNGATPQTGGGAVPAGNTTLCDPGTAPGANGGGAGGSFGGAGANGGNNHGVAGATKAATTLRGGCAGQDGRTGVFGLKGQGGGAVYLIATTAIAVTGAIDASGGGATGGAMGGAGGGGGGAGGMIGLDAPSVSVTGVVFANGGGGAEGSGNSTKGNDGNESVNGAAAATTASASNGGEGGGGAAQGVAPVTGIDAAGFGGGGGGGGLGVIKLFGATSIVGGGTVSPTAS